MNRLPRRPSRQQPPLRGRLAVSPRSAFRQSRSTAAVISRPISARQRRGRRSPSAFGPPPSVDLAKLYDWLAHLYQRWPGLFRLLNRPWQWLLLVVIIILLLSAIGRLS